MSRLDPDLDQLVNQSRMGCTVRPAPAFKGLGASFVRIGPAIDVFVLEDGPVRIGYGFRPIRQGHDEEVGAIQKRLGLVSLLKWGEPRDGKEWGSTCRSRW